MLFHPVPAWVGQDQPPQHVSVSHLLEGLVSLLMEISALQSSPVQISLRTYIKMKKYPDRQHQNVIVEG